MRALSITIIVSTLALGLAGCDSSKSLRSADAAGGSSKSPAISAGKPTASGARLYSGFGNYSRTITTNSPQAQKWFNQGMQLLYGFNHDEAIRSFEQAAAIDPSCAMAWWGVSYAHGLHINNPIMTEAQSRDGYSAASKALAALDNETPAEQALVRAVLTRYAWPIPEDRKPLDIAYANAMQAAWQAHPDDPDIGTLYAESLMDLQPWDLWTHAGEPKGRTMEIVATLEEVMTIDPMHPGANHLYIHAVEASPSPERAVIAAERLTNLVPGSGHLTHMPSHIWIRTGRYADAVDTNARAVEVDAAYFAIAPPPNFYSLYYLHNVHFLAYAAMFEGRYETAMNAARRMEREAPESFIREYTPVADGLTPVAYHVMIRFGKWDDILNEPEAEEYRLISRATRLYARAVALAALGRPDEARTEMAQFDALVKTIDDTWFVGNNPAPSVLAISRKMMEGEILYREGQREQAFAVMREAVAMEENLNYDEPPGWMQPVRHALGALLLESEQAAEAEAVYRADLVRHPNNGWSLLGLSLALEAQGESDEAAEVADALALAWARADVRPTASCYCATGG